MTGYQHPDAQLAIKCRECGRDTSPGVDLCDNCKYYQPPSHPWANLPTRKER